ncbi:MULTISPECIES: efflux RND transporter periplasmic adaptor subunit [Flavobacteriaceae]|uniref:efflux RND transporter periplasmic adaptor subunit n=1 Tax=Flavobacteriaceae TaxID=49546 RepID=UPI00149291C2|nr:MULTISPECIES: HlyD family efflux transporter periplasmic adaptor subunit [Allomuricauda]MDC6365621.1 HlyD family efflux transporter periplasmic adaptor subunit [Muricauda sp. AC10]
MRKLIISAVVGGIIIFGSLYFAGLIAGSKSNKRPPSQKVIKTVFVDTVQNGIVPIVVPANGNLRAKKRLELFAEVQGVFRQGSKLFRTGQEYNAGQTLIRIDANEYYASVQSAKSSLYNLLTSIMPDLRLDYPEIYPKWQEYLNKFDLDKTTPELPKMSSEKEKFFITGRGVISNYYNVKNLEQRLSKYTIAAPFKGVLTDALVTEGTLIRSGQKLGEFINTGVYELEVSVSKTYSDFLKVGKKVELSNLEKTETYPGEVTRVNASVDQNSQTVTVYIEVKNEALKEGQYLEANLQAKQEQEAVEMDRSLLLENNQIFVVRDSILDRIDVTPVYFTDKKMVLKNVPDGEVVVSKALTGAYAGMLVKVFDGSKPKNTNP